MTIIIFTILAILIVIIIQFFIFNKIPIYNESQLNNSNNDKIYDNLFSYISQNNQPQYRIEWLKKSLESGHELESNGYYVIKSIENNLPYYCENENEFDKFYNNETPVLKGSIPGMINFAFLYHEVNKENSNPLKKQYWYDKLCELANKGNREAQAALCSNFAKTTFGEEEVIKNKERFELKIIEEAKEGDKYAQLGMGRWLVGANLDEGLYWLNKAADQGLTDACYYITGLLMQKYFFSDISEQEKNVIYLKVIQYFKRGAEYSNGVTSGYCQYRYADECYDGKYIARDLASAKFWFQKAFENGVEIAKFQLEFIDTERTC